MDGGTVIVHASLGARRSLTAQHDLNYTRHNILFELLAAQHGLNYTHNIRSTQTLTLLEQPHARWRRQHTAVNDEVGILTLIGWVNKQGRTYIKRLDERHVHHSTLGVRIS